MPFSLPPELSLEFICGTVTSEACVLVTDAAVTAGAGLLLLKREKLWNAEDIRKAMVLHDLSFITSYVWPVTTAGTLPTVQRRTYVSKKVKVSTWQSTIKLKQWKLFQIVNLYHPMTVFKSRKRLYLRQAKIKAVSTQNDVHGKTQQLCTERWNKTSVEGLEQKVCF